MGPTSVLGVICAAVLAAGGLAAGGLAAQPGPAAGLAGSGASTAARPGPGPYAEAVSRPVEDPYYPSKGDPRLDTLHYDLDLRWAPRHGRLTGTATIDLRVARDTGTLLLDLSRHLSVTTTTLDGDPVTSTRRDNHLVVDAGRALSADTRHELVVGYSGRPRPAHPDFARSDIRDLGWHTEDDGSAWAMQEPFGAFTWYPVNDHPSDKALYDARIDVPQRMVGVFNGDLVSRRHVAGRQVTRWHLADPAASYLVTIGIGDYVRVQQRGPRGVPLSYWLPREHSAKELRVARSLRPSMRWLEDRLGPYPFDQAGILATPSGSGMETQTLISLNRGILRNGGRNVIAHELAHQWYGDTVTPRTWPDLWLNESWAMYTQIRWEAARHRSHPDGSRYQSMREWRQLLINFDNDLRAEDGPPGAYHPRDFAGGTVYYCGALMLDQLRAKIGDEAFADLWRAWPQQHRNADRGDWIAFANARTGRDLEPFITRWLTAAKTPPLVRR